MFDIDAEFSKASSGGFRMGLSGLLVAALVVLDPLGRFAVLLASGRGGQRLGLDPDARRLADLLDGEVEARGRFFL